MYESSKGINKAILKYSSGSFAEIFMQCFWRLANQGISILISKSFNISLRSLYSLLNSRLTFFLMDINCFFTKLLCSTASTKSIFVVCKYLQSE
jgi:hypothetical protein